MLMLVLYFIYFYIIFFEILDKRMNMDVGPLMSPTKTRSVLQSHKALRAFDVLSSD